MKNIVLLFVLLSVGACATSPPNHYYLLMPSTGTDAPTRSILLPEVTIGIPAYLDRPQIVMDRGGGQVELLEFERWAEPVDRMIGRVVRQDMAAHLPGARVASTIDLNIDAFTFESNKVELRAHWSVLRADPDKTDNAAVPIHYFAQTLPAPGNDLPGLVAAMSALMDALSQAIIQPMPR